MSIPVDVAELERALEHFGPGYLLTVSAASAVKAVSVRPELVDGAFVVTAPGRGSVTNAGTNANVTLLFPPVADDGLTLLVDGMAFVHGDDVRVEPTGAVLHQGAS